MSIQINSILSPVCRFATLSHSFEAGGHLRVAGGSGFNTITDQTNGSIFWLQAMMGPRFDAPYMTTGKHGGQPLATMLAGAPAHIAECQSKGVNLVLLIGIYNDSYGTLSASDDVIAKIRAIALLYSAAGIRLIITDDCPTGSPVVRNSAGLAGLGRIAEACVDMGNTIPFVKYVSIYGAQVDPATGLVLPGLMKADGYHPAAKSHFRYAYAIFKEIDKLFPSIGYRSQSDNLFPYNASLNKRGNILTNGMMTGDVSGVATSWTAGSAPSGITVTPTKGLDADGTPYQQIAYTGTASGAGAGHGLRQDPSTTRFNQSDVHRPAAYVLVKKSDAATGFINLRGIEVQGSLTTSSPSNNYSSQAGYANGVNAEANWPSDFDLTQFNEGRGLFLRGPESTIVGPWTTETPFARFTVNVFFDAAAATDVVIQIRRAEWKKSFAASGY